MNRKTRILSALNQFVAQPPGMEYCDYGDIKAYRSDYQPILQAKHDFAALFNAVQLCNITAQELADSFSAFSGRLELSEGDKLSLTYTAGQYFPTEYRRAACAVLAQALWAYWRSELATGEAIRKAARDNLGRGIASRWFY